ncbi:MAG: amidase family protein, partial [Bryobacteraceae bacterium]
MEEAALPFATIPDLNAALRSREISSAEMTKFFGRRLEKFGPVYNALACSTLKPAHRAAKQADYDLKRGRFRGPLQGVPYGAKDLLAFAKYPTTWGAKPFADQVFD